MEEKTVHRTDIIESMEIWFFFWSFVNGKGDGYFWRHQNGEEKAAM